MKTKFFKPVMLLIIALVLGCSKDDEPTPTPKNQAPKSFSISSPQNNAIGVSVTPTLKWSAATDPDGDAVVYDVHIGTDNPPATAVAQKVSGTSHEVSSALEYETKYYCRIIAKDAKGARTESAVASFTTAKNATPSAAVLTKPAHSATGIERTPTLEWEASQDPEGEEVTYDIYFGTTNPPTVAVSENQTETTFSVPDADALDFETTYYWFIKAKDSNGGGTDSEVFSFTVVENKAPEAFNLMTIIHGLTDASLTPAFEWQTASDPEGEAVTYSFLLSENGGTSFKTLANGNSGTTYKITTNLKHNTKYRWKVIARDAFGNTTESTSTFDFTTRGLRATEVTSNRSTSRRFYESLVVNNRLYTMGGVLSSSFTSTTRINSSTDGNVWLTQPDLPQSRHDFGLVSFNNRIWVIGGARTTGTTSRYNTVYSQSNGGGAWTTHPNAPFSRRRNHATVVFKNKIWVIGGVSSSSFGTAESDIWSSSDGESWTREVTNAPFGARNRFQTLVYKDELYVIGGYQTTGINKNVNDIWKSSDGITWTEVSSTIHKFSPRRDHAAVVYKDRIYVIGGWDNSSGRVNDIWYSEDGCVTWTRDTATGGFPMTTGIEAQVFNDKIFLIGGLRSSGTFIDAVWTLD